MEKQIILTKEEKAVIEKHLAGNFNIFFSEEQEQNLLSKVIKDADALMKELDAYDELDDNLLAWYYNKYKSQTTA